MSEKDDVQLSDALRTKSVGTLDRKVLEFLVCPVTKGGLRYDASTQELCSMAAEIAFPIRDGIAILLVSEARSLASDQTE